MAKRNIHHDSSLTWDSFQNYFDVQADTFDEHRLIRLFETKYYNKVVEWKGTVIRVDSQMELDEVVRDTQNKD